MSHTLRHTSSRFVHASTRPADTDGSACGPQLRSRDPELVCETLTSAVNLVALYNAKTLSRAGVAVSRDACVGVDSVHALTRAALEAAAGATLAWKLVRPRAHGRPVTWHGRPV